MIKNDSVQKEGDADNQQPQLNNIHEENDKVLHTDKSIDQPLVNLENHVNLDDDDASVATAYDESLHPDSPKDSVSVPSLVEDSQGHYSPIRGSESPIREHESTLSPNQHSSKNSSSDMNFASHQEIQGTHVSDSLKNQVGQEMHSSAFPQRVHDDLQLVSKFWEGASIAYDLNEKDLVQVPVMSTDQEFTMVLSKSERMRLQKLKNQAKNAEFYKAFPRPDNSKSSS